MNVFTVLTYAATAAEALVAAGLKVPASILDVIAKAPAAISAGEAVVAAIPSVSALVTSGSFTLPTAAADLAAAAALIPATGNAQADAAVKNIVAAAGTVSADLTNLLAGQAVSIASDNVSISGKPYHVHVVVLVSGGPAAAALGL